MKRVVLALSIAAACRAPAVLAAEPAPFPTAGAPPAKGRVIERIVAVVNDNVVLQSEVETVFDQMMQAEPPPAGVDPAAYREAHRKEIIDTLVAEKLLEEEVRKLRIDVTDAEIDRVIEATKREHKLDDAQLKEALGHQGLSLEDYRDGLKKQLTKMKIIQLKVKSRVQVSDNDVKSTLAQQKTLNAAEYRVKARHILFMVAPGSDPGPAKARADRTLARLQKGESFDELAAELSDDTATKKRGGSLGEFGRKEMVPEFEKAAFAAQPGAVVGPVRTSFGWHIIKVDERVAAPEKTGDAALEDIRQRLYESEVEQQFKRYLEELKKSAFIEVRPQA